MVRTPYGTRPVPGKLVLLLAQACLTFSAHQVRAQAAPPPVTGGGIDLPSVIVVPRNYSHDEKLGNGCWVRFFDDKSYGGRSLTLIGPVEMPKIHIPGGLWVNWSSAAVGPNATVTTYDFEQFQNRTAVLQPGQRIPDLKDRKLGLFEDIHSVRITCKS
jgi:hypothetical protein